MARTFRFSKTLILLSILCGACFSQQFQVSKIAARVAASNVDIGPDGHLYAVNANIPANAERQSRLLRYRLDESGVPTGVIDTIYTWANLSDCTVGLAFDPDSTPDLVHAYVSISQDAFVYEWGGRIERIVIPATGDATRQILYYGLPVGFHQINDIGFGPDGKLIIQAGSTTTSGMPGHFSNEWNEKVLSAAFLKAVVRGKNDATNVQTAGGYSYNPNAENAPLTTWVVSIRNPFDGTWHSNGNYYAGTNQNDVNGDTGDCNGQTQNLANQRPEEFLAIIRPQNTYGFPNPSRSECVLMGGNPTAGVDPWEVPDYRVGITPPTTFDPTIMFNTANVGGNSPDGILEYQAEGDLKHKLIQAFYSYWGYIMTYTLGEDGKVAATRRLQDETGQDIAIPWILDLAEHPVTGHLYAAAYGDQADNGGAGGIFFLKRTTPVPTADMLKTDMLNFKIDAIEGVNPPNETVRVWNAGTTGTALKYTLASDVSWITLTSANGESTSGMIPQRKPHTLIFDLGNLAQGVHTGRVTVSATGQTPVVITVTMTVANNTKLSNKEPQVDAGSNQNLVIAADKLPLTVTLSGSATDDGWPNPPGYITFSWLLYQGDASAVTINNSHNATTTAVINHFGIFVFQLHVSDGDKISSSLVTYFIDQVGNSAPKITLFTADHYTVHLGTVVKLNVAATDDGLPNPPSKLVYQWGRVETGVGIATFTNDTATETYVSFSEVSSYLLQCTVSDSTQYTSDHFVIIVVDANVTITDSSAASTGSSEVTQQTRTSAATTANTAPSNTIPASVPATQQGSGPDMSCESTPDVTQTATRPAEPSSGNGATTTPRQTSDAVKVGISALVALGLLFV